MHGSNFGVSHRRKATVDLEPRIDRWPRTYGDQGVMKLSTSIRSVCNNLYKHAVTIWDQTATKLASWSD